MLAPTGSETPLGADEVAPAGSAVGPTSLPGPSVITGVEALERGHIKLMVLRAPGVSDLVSVVLLASEQSISLGQAEVLVDKLANALAARETLMPNVARKRAHAAVHQMRGCSFDGC